MLSSWNVEVWGVMVVMAIKLAHSDELPVSGSNYLFEVLNRVSPLHEEYLNLVEIGVLLALQDQEPVPST